MSRWELPVPESPIRQTGRPADRLPRADPHALGEGAHRGGRDVWVRGDVDDLSYPG
jgi:hypothetical protein